MQYNNCRIVQLLPYLDRSGRRIISIFLGEIPLLTKEEEQNQNGQQNQNGVTSQQTQQSQQTQDQKMNEVAQTIIRFRVSFELRLKKIISTTVLPIYCIVCHIIVAYAVQSFFFLPALLHYFTRRPQSSPYYTGQSIVIHYLCCWKE